MAKKTFETVTEPVPTNGAADLSELRTMWGNIDGILSLTDDAALRAELAAAALKVLVAKANKLITTLEEKA